MNRGWEGWMEDQKDKWDDVKRWMRGWQSMNGRMKTNEWGMRVDEWEDEKMGGSEEGRWLMEYEKIWMGGWEEMNERMTKDEWEDEKRWMRGWQRMNGRKIKDEWKDEKGWMERWKRMNGKMWRDK
jgi:hypothetical protein